MHRLELGLWFFPTDSVLSERKRMLLTFEGFLNTPEEIVSPSALLNARLFGL